MLNVVYIGAIDFPSGGASSKRRRYMIDYLNSVGISSHVLVCDIKRRNKVENPIMGNYGKCSYYCITSLAIQKRYYSFFKEGKHLLCLWYKHNVNNVLIFHTLLNPIEYPFFRYAYRLGYKIVFDQVETDYCFNGKVNFFHRLNLILSNTLSKHAYKKSASIVISTLLEEEVKLQNPGRKVQLVPNATIEIGKAAPPEKRDYFQLLYAGTFSSKDGVDYLIDGFILSSKKNNNCKLILVGNGQRKDVEHIKNKIQGFSAIEYRGFVSEQELLYLLRTSDMLCVTRDNSKFANYGFPFKLSEYLSTGNLVLATKVGDIPMYLKDRENALLVEPESEIAISDAIQYACSNREECQRMASNGLRVMQEHFSINRVGQTFIQFLETL